MSQDLIQNCIVQYVRGDITTQVRAHLDEFEEELRKKGVHFSFIPMFQNKTIPTYAGQILTPSKNSPVYFADTYEEMRIKLLKEAIDYD